MEYDEPEFIPYDDDLEEDGDETVPYYEIDTHYFGPNTNIG